MKKRIYVLATIVCITASLASCKGKDSDDTVRMYPHWQYIHPGNNGWMFYMAPWP